jgi:response regulator NasT
MPVGAFATEDDRLGPGSNAAPPVRVVIAEDEWLITAALRRQMESYGCVVLAAVGTGAQAVTACAGHPDLVLMDVQMPEMDGLEATRRLMETSPVCVVIVTGKAKQEEAAEQAGAMDYVMKPLMSDRIPALVTRARQRFARFAALDREAASHEDALQAWAAVRRAVKALVESDDLTEDQAFDRVEAEAQGQRTLARAVS